MRTVSVVLWLSAVLTTSRAWAADGSSSSFSADRFLAHIRHLASDDLAGRGLGSKGLDEAAEYIATQFSKAGVKPGGEDGGYFQAFPVAMRKQVPDGARLAWNGHALEAGKDFETHPVSSCGAFDAPVAFVGYGVTAPKLEYDDYADIDVKGKVLLLLRYVPHDRDDKPSFGAKRDSEHSLFTTKLALARKHGAAAVLLVNRPKHDGERDQLVPFRGGPIGAGLGVPFLHLERRAADKLLKAGGLDDLATLQDQLDTKRRPLSADLTGVRVKGDAGLQTLHTKPRNVVGVVRGEGPLRDEYLVIGAHYDHLGVAPLQFRRQSGGEKHIHNGADDNASGTAAVIELGRRLAGEAAELRRSVVLIAFAGEERGLLGSRHYVSHPTVPIEKMVAMLNMDMIGRLEDDKLQVFGVKTAEPLEKMIEELGGGLGLDLTLHGSGTGPSDHTSFYNKKMPALHFCTGQHGDYHRPSDDTEKINAEGGAVVTELVYRVARRLIARDDRLAFRATKSGHAGGAPNTKVRLGLVPSYGEDDEKGMMLSGVAPEGPAEKAGLKAGDRIIKLGDIAVDDVYGLMRAMAPLEPDKTVPIVVQRGDKRLTLKITPEAR